MKSQSLVSLRKPFFTAINNQNWNHSQTSHIYCSLFIQEPEKAVVMLNKFTFINYVVIHFSTFDLLASISFFSPLLFKYYLHGNRFYLHESLEDD